MQKNKFEIKVKNDNNINSNLLNKVKGSEEYVQNQMQIDCIRNVLIEHGDVPEKLIDWLIDSVKANTELEFKAIHKL
ncbi:MAG: hypothetical protein ACI4VQ_08090 [Clostridia bacterium]